MPTGAFVMIETAAAVLPWLHVGRAGRVDYNFTHIVQGIAKFLGGWLLASVAAAAAWSIAARRLHRRR